MPRRADRLIGGEQPSSQLRLHAERLQVPSDTNRLRTCSGSATPVTVANAGEPDAEVLERTVLLGVGEVHRWREAEVAGELRHADAPGAVCQIGDELGRVRIGQRAEQDAVDDAEDGGVGADAYRQGHQDDGGEEGRAGERVRAE